MTARLLAALLLVAASARAERPHTEVQVGLGPSVRMLYDVPYATGGARLVIGREFTHFGILGELDTEVGIPSVHLPILHARAGATFEVLLGQRWRLGAGPRFGVITLFRATDGQPATGLTTGLSVTSSVELWSDGPRSLRLGIEGGAEGEWFIVHDIAGFAAAISPIVAVFLVMTFGG